MRAVKNGKSLDVVLDDLETPRPGRGMVRVQTLRAGICGSDLHTLRQLRSGILTGPTYPGHEVCGVVAELGDDVEGVALGNRVAVEPLARCGECQNCRGGNYNMCAQRAFILGVYPDRPGALAEYFTIPSYCLVSLPAALEDREGALVEPLAVAVHALKVAGLGFRRSVGVIGAGTIGLCAVMAASAAGASQVISVAKHAHQREAALVLGATKVLELSEDATEDRILPALDGLAQPDVVVETVGGAAGTINLGLEFVRPGGTLSVVGAYWENDRVNLNRMLSKEVRIAASNCYAAPGGASDFEDAIAIIERNPAFARTMITHEFGLGEASRAFQTAFDKATGSVKVMLEP